MTVQKRYIIECNGTDCTNTYTGEGHNPVIVPSREPERTIRAARREGWTGRSPQHFCPECAAERADDEEAADDDDDPAVVRITSGVTRGIECPCCDGRPGYIFHHTTGHERTAACSQCYSVFPAEKDGNRLTVFIPASIEYAGTRIADEDRQ